MNTINEINLLRGLGIIGVIAIHATAPIIHPEYNGTSGWVNLMIVINQLSRFSVPLFFFISGYLYGKKYAENNIDYISYICSRIKNIYIPFLFWSFLYISMRVATSDISIENDFIIKIFIIIITGDSYGHLYFIPAIFQFYLSLPILLWIAKKINRLNYNIIFLSVLIVAFTVIYYFRLHYISGGNIQYLFFKTYWFYWWYPFAALGIQLGISSNSMFRFNKIFLVSFALLALTAICCQYIYSYSVVSAVAQEYVYDLEKIATFLNPITLLFSISSLLYLHYYAKNTYLIKLSFIEKLGIYSFGIYFLHPLVNKIVIKLIKIFFEFDITRHIISFPILGFVCFYITYVLVKKCDNYGVFRYLMGSSRANEK